MSMIEDVLREFAALAQAVLGLGRESHDLSWGQMAARALVVYVAVLVMVRLGKKRFMARATAFDVILGIMLGSIVARAITGNAPLGPALAAGATLIAIHWLFSWIALRWRGFGGAIKGHAQLLVRDGQVDWDEMRRAHMTDRDLREDLRAKSVSDAGDVAEARLERDGSLSVIKAKKAPKVVDVRVADGVQTVRIELG